MQLQDATAIVTGAARGLGREFTRKILNAGGRVLMTDVDFLQLEASYQSLAQEHRGRVDFMKQDVSDLDSFDSAFDKANQSFSPAKVNLLVNNAGIRYPSEKFYTDDSTAWTKLVDINVTSVLRGTQVALRRLSNEKGQPVIVNVSSMAGFIAAPGAPIYSATKHAVVSFTKAVGSAKASQVRVVGLCPAFAESEMGTIALKEAPDMVKQFGGLMTGAYIADGLAKVIVEADNAGASLIITKRHGYKYMGKAKAKKSKL
ncbi:unnamed protein product [Aphanomyces euteiches]|uniref:Uncharacterized protein n=1 Tax=Aphanomyces euteiches TaxID=100861 RepID=A0A6G0XJM1_9STRA|nr:hypothetical protein Ae201684_004048 [Aphanomyces euteiches]KAH9093608.1 hypothetical protein Ae201684P_016235 [Aphanomyces euteiches]KAH9144563.1 hypothetical protein AeRB84_011510 [Aphanomyces euteiches]